MIYNCNMNIFLCHPIKKSANHITASKHATHQQSVSGIESRLLNGDPGTPMITITTEHYGTTITSGEQAPASSSIGHTNQIRPDYYQVVIV